MKRNEFRFGERITVMPGFASKAYRRVRTAPGTDTFDFWGNLGETDLFPRP
jgi:hypothetical protein